VRPWEIQPERYDALFAEKCEALADAFAALGAPPAERLASPVDSYRVRAEFRMWHDGERLDYVMFDSAAPREPVRVEDFPPAIAPIRGVMPALRQRLAANAVLRRKLFQAEFLATADGEVLVSLIYHRRLDDAWEREARLLADDLGIAIIGRSRGQKCVLHREFVTERYEVDGESYRFRQYEQSFVQPNGRVNAQMLAWACRQAAPIGQDLLELYCGNGNFTIPMARHFPRVIATELSKVGTRAARENLELNGVDHVQVLRLSAEEVSAALGGERDFRRLAALPQPLAAYALDTVFVDPPRAGLDTATLACVRRFDNVLYISCNPQTLLANLRVLGASHDITALAFFDQFPYTPHLECGVVLRQRGP